MLSNIRTQVLIKLIKPYTRVHIPFIAKELNIEKSDVENLLVTCILDELVLYKLSFIFTFLYNFNLLCCRTIKGRIDQTNQVLTLTLVDSATNRYAAIDKWTNQLATLNLSISQKIF